MDILAADYPNLRGALEWFHAQREIEDGLRLAGTLAWFWQMRGPVADGNGWLRRFLAEGGLVGTGIRADALAGAGLLNWNLGEYATAEQRLDEALGIWRFLDDRPGIVRTLNWVARVTASRGNVAATVAVNEEALRLAREVGDTVWIACTLGSVGYSLIQSGQIDEARRALEEAAALQEETGYEPGLGWALTGLGNIALLQGDGAAAAALYRDALALAKKNHGLGTFAHHLPRLAAAEAATGRPENAARLLGMAAALQKPIGKMVEQDPTSGYASTADAVRATLGETRFMAAWSGGRAMSPDEAIAEALEGSPMPISPGPPSGGLTPRESDVLRLMADGLTNQQIADELFNSKKTIENHAASILSKLDVTSRTAAVSFAFRNGLV